MSQVPLTLVLLLLTAGFLTLRSSTVRQTRFPLVWSFVSHKQTSSVVMFLYHYEGNLASDVYLMLN